MSGRVPIGSFLVLIGTFTGLAYGLMAATTPSEQQFYDALAPDLKRKVDAARAMKAGAQSELIRESQEKLEAIKKQAQGEGPVWADAIDPRKK
ncbi:hypothetical protein JCM10450v2_008072 [Rhodotorula kratochvilovae]